MKYKDLMVGGWVNYKSPSSGKLHPIKIENIYGVEFNCEVEDWNIISGKSISDTEPITLTEDILVKNGWDFTKRGYSVYCKEDTNGDVELSKDEYGFYWSINCDEYVILRIDYVHTLQHLLRLCCIEKELVID